MWLQVERGVRTSVAAGKQGGGWGGLSHAKAQLFPGLLKKSTRGGSRSFNVIDLGATGI